MISRQGRHCLAPIEQRRGEPVVTVGELLDTKHVFLDLTDIEQVELKAIKDKARVALQGEIDLKKNKYIEKRAVEMVPDVNEKCIVAARETVERAIEHDVLPGDFPLTMENGTGVTVSDVLDDPATFHG